MRKKKPIPALGPKHVILNTGQWEHDIFVFINCRSKDIKKIIAKYDGVKGFSDENYKSVDECENNGARYYYSHEDQHRAMCLFSDTWAGILALFDHEKLHCVFDVLNYSGVQYCRESEETYTYLSGYMMKQFLKKA